VAVNAEYTVAGQALRGVRALLLSFGPGRCHALCLIGVPRETFNELQARAAVAAEAGHAAEGCGDSIQRVEAMLNAGEHVQMPVELCQAFIGTSPAAQVIRRLILCAARTDIPVLIEGESGTGKEIVANWIHLGSVRKGYNLFPVNCGAVPAELFESELFGHEKGSFTGAAGKKDGMWTLADKGTLFLDEIGDLSPCHQAKVLRALDGYGYLPVGAAKEVKSDARVIAATNRDLAAMVRQGTFREDLYYRLFSFRIRTYPLRQHEEDIPLLAQHFWRKVSEPKQVPELSPAVLEELKKWRWPGNARELRSFLANTLAFAGGEPVTVELIRNVFRDRLGPQVTVLSQDS
jgi:transcriptional regulator with GAF, ATPase, and Fis domain